MFEDKETKFWQKEYRKGNLDNVDMPGEIRSILDGSAERMGKLAYKICVVVLVIIVISQIICKLT